MTTFTAGKPIVHRSHVVPPIAPIAKSCSSISSAIFDTLTRTSTSYFDLFAREIISERCGQAEPNTTVIFSMFLKFDCSRNTSIFPATLCASTPPIVNNSFFGAVMLALRTIDCFLNCENAGFSNAYFAPARTLPSLLLNWAYSLALRI